MLLLLLAAITLASCAVEPLGPSPQSGLEGESLYYEFTCSGCHTVDGSKSTGSTFKGLYLSTVTLSNGKTVVADEDYLIESITDPAAKIVKGFESVPMPPNGGSLLSDQDVLALVEFIKSLK